MLARMNLRRALLCLLAVACTLRADPLPGTQPLNEDGDLAAKMVQGIHRFLDRETVEVTKARAALWKPDTSSPDAWEKSMEPKRARLRQLLGISDLPLPAPATSGQAPQFEGFPKVARFKSSGEAIETVSWPSAQVEGLMTTGKGLCILVPDCGTTPEAMYGITAQLPPERQYANRLAASGFNVLALALTDREAGQVMPEGRSSKFSRREVLWRAGFEMGRTLLGYEVQKVLATVQAFRGEVDYLPTNTYLVGSGEGGLIALLVAALDERFDWVAVEGAFAPLDASWEQPIDRTVFGLLREFSMADIAAMIAPRPVIILNDGWPAVTLTDAGGGAPGKIAAPDLQLVEAERKKLETRLQSYPPTSGNQARPKVTVVTDRKEFLAAIVRAGELTAAAEAQTVERTDYYYDEMPNLRQNRMFNNLLAITQTLMRQAQKARGEYWKGADMSSAEKFAESAKAYREKFWTDVTGKLPPATLPPNVRSRQIYDTEKFTGWEVMLNVYPDVFAFGTLLLPKDLKPGEKRAVVVCQHGLEGRPSDVADPAQDNPAYHRYAARLAEKGYIVFAPQNPYIGKTEFRQICRKAWPIGLSLWSFIVRQHETILTWLKTQPNVDASRIAFYGLSYGGKSAMRLPALLPDYCLSICSADYNEWIWKNVDASAPYSYLHTNEYDMVEWNMGNTFNYAELSWLIFPRPFMVERGHDDGVSCDEWVAYEFARTRRHYSKLGLGDRAEIEFFNGPHTINGQGTFRFLDKWLAK